MKQWEENQENMCSFNFLIFLELSAQRGGGGNTPIGWLTRAGIDTTDT